MVRDDVDDSFYHVYGRGSFGRSVFKTDEDKMFFLGLLERYLGSKTQKNMRTCKLYENYFGRIDLLAYCIMDTHFHLLFWQKESGLISQLMKSVLVSYSAYYNKKYSQRGPLLESRFKASRIDDENYLLHLTRYIHLNPDDYRDYLWSSLGYFVAGLEEDWVRPDKIIEMFDLTYEGYWDLLKDYEVEDDALNQMKDDFADDGKSIDAQRQENP